MFGRLLPRETSFFDYFERHAALTVEGAKVFLALASEGQDVAGHAGRIKELENQADTVTHECVAALHKTFITPIDRDAVHRLISKLDDILDYIEAAAKCIDLYEIPPLSPSIKEMAEVVLRGTELVGVALEGLRDMKHAEDVLAKCVEINSLEHEGDLLLRTAMVQLFKTEKDPIQVIKLKELYELLETVTDKCEDVANEIEGIVLEHA